MKVTLTGYQNVGNDTQAVQTLCRLVKTPVHAAHSVLSDIANGQSRMVDGLQQVGDWPNILRFIAAGGKVQVS